MKKYFILYLVLFFCSSAQATDSFYYVNYAYDTDKAIICDKQVRDYSSQFTDDMRNLISTYQNKEYSKSEVILNEYGITKNNNSLLKNKFISSVLTCSAIYKFNGNINYYRELMATMTLFILKVSYTVIDSHPHDNDVKNLYEKTINYFNIVLNSTNKTANKSSNLTGAENAPSS